MHPRLPATIASTSVPAERSEAVDGPGKHKKSAMFVPVAGHDGLYLKKTLAINVLQGQRTTVYADGGRELRKNFPNKEQ